LLQARRYLFVDDPGELAMANKISGIDGRPVQVGGGAPVSRVRDTTSEGRKAESTGASNIDVSDTARTLAALEDRISTLPIVSESRVDAVRKAMDEGRYHVDPQRVADKMLRFEVDLLAAIPAHK
jgi:negative regulator of flagellin synthesis FlgM